MKGIVLAGGKGTRMYPLTKVTNKHLLPIYDKPMIYYPIMTLASAGIKDILIVVGGESLGDFLKLLGSGKELGVTITYRVQDGAEGIGAALMLAEEFVDGDKFMLVLGDNIMEENLAKHARDFEKGNNGCHLFFKKVHDPERYGTAELDGNRLVAIHEKAKNPPTDLCVAGVYLFDSECFELMPKLKPSGRGEIEVGSVIQYYIDKGNVTWSILKEYWTDAGTLESWYDANVIVRNKREKKEKKQP